MIFLSIVKSTDMLIIAELEVVYLNEEQTMGNRLSSESITSTQSYIV